MEDWKRYAKAVAATLGLCCLWALVASPAAPGPQETPVYRVDPYWPKPLPNKWMIQQIPTMTVDKDDHVWVFNRSRQMMPDELGASTTPPRADCCAAAPSLLEFDAEGNLLKAWGGPGYVPNWP